MGPDCSLPTEHAAEEELFQASMGIYVFNREVAGGLPQQRAG